jgi:hypothetical protein
MTDIVDTQAFFFMEVKSFGERDKLPRELEWQLDDQTTVYEPKFVIIGSDE